MYRSGKELCKQRTCDSKVQKGGQGSRWEEQVVFFLSLWRPPLASFLLVWLAVSVTCEDLCFQEGESGKLVFLEH